MLSWLARRTLRALLLTSSALAIILLTAFILLQPQGQVSGFLGHGTPDPARTPLPPGDPTAKYTFYRDIKPILETNCMGCHHEGGIGHSAFAMNLDNLSKEDADGIADVVGTGYMPPWLPGPESMPMVDKRSLDAAQIEAIQVWAQSGAPLGDPKDYVAIATPEPRQIRADLTLKLPVVYTPDASKSDDYRCFLIDPKITQDTYVTGYTILPDAISVVHHVIMFQAGKEALPEIQKLDAEDERPGWECFGGPGLRGDLANRAAQIGAANSSLANAAGGSNNLGAWAPGSQPVIHPAGTGSLLKAGDLIIMQMHYNLSSGTKPDQTAAVLQIAAPGEQIARLRTRILFAPVEIPCPAGRNTPDCSRNTALVKASASVTGSRTILFSTAFLGLCKRSVGDYEKQRGGTVTSSCERSFNEDSMIVSVFPHMHTRGQRIRVEINPDTPESKVVIDIPFWDFHWQGFYQLQTPTLLRKTDTVRITCTWDNSNITRYMLWGEGTDDEMCIAGLITMPTR